MGRSGLVAWGKLVCLCWAGFDYSEEISHGIARSECDCEGCDEDYTIANPALWGVGSTQCKEGEFEPDCERVHTKYHHDPALGCAAACFNNETNNRLHRPMSVISNDHEAERKKGFTARLHAVENTFNRTHSVTHLVGGQNTVGASKRGTPPQNNPRGDQSSIEHHTLSHKDVVQAANSRCTNPQQTRKSASASCTTKVGRSKLDLSYLGVGCEPDHGLNTHFLPMFS